MGFATAAFALRILAGAVVAAPATTSVTVIALDEDPAAAGALESAVQSRVAAIPGSRVLSPVPTGIAPPPEIVDLAAGHGLEDALNAAYKDYYDGKLDRALDDAQLAERIADSSGAKVREHIRILFWEATVYLDHKDVVGAGLRIAGALALDRSAAVDLGVYPPQLAQAVEKARASVHPTASLAITVPAGATATIDDRPATGRVALAPGRHWIAVTAPGYRRVDSHVDLVDGQSLTVAVGLAPRLAPEDAAALAWLAEGHGAEDATRRRDALSRAATLARRAGADAVVVAVEVGDPLTRQLHAFIARADGLQVSPAFPPMPEGAGPLASWLTATLAPPVARGGGGGFAPAGTPGTLAIEAGGSAVTDVWTRIVHGGVATTFVGVGPEIAVDATRDRWRLDLGFLAESYALSTLQVSVDGAASSTAHGASARELWLGGGRRFGEGERDTSLTLLLRHRDQDGVDARDATGPLAVLPGFTRDSLELHGAIGIPIAAGRRSPAELVLDAAVIPWSRLRETPPGATGDAPRPGIGAAAGATLTFHGAGRSNLALGWHAAWRPTRFSGPSNAAYDPPLSGAHVDELQQIVTLGLSWRAR